MKEVKPITRHLVITGKYRHQLIDITSIIRIEAISNYSKVYFTNGTTMIVTKILRWFEEQLASEPFIRTHRTHLVNRNFISYYVNGMGGRVKLLNGEWVDVSKRKRMHFLHSLKKKAA
jgi:two-component system, LytTR family, response regulator